MLQVKDQAYATTEATKLSLAYYLFEELLLEHNVKGQDYEDGKMSEAEWKAYLNDVFNPKTSALSSYINAEKQVAAKTAFHSTQGVTLDNAFEAI